jgi:hypothetical protein
MTLFTVGSEMVFVRIFMATVAIFERHIGKALKRQAVFYFLFMAFQALHQFVFAFQRKIGSIVVKLARWCKLFGRVAFRAIIPEGFLVVIGMTG